MDLLKEIRRECELGFREAELYTAELDSNKKLFVLMRESLRR